MGGRSPLLACALVAAALLGCASNGPSGAAVREPVLEAIAPEAQDPAEIRIVLANPGFESTVVTAHGVPDGWLAAQHAGDISYAFRVDGVAPRAGRYSGRIDNIGIQPFGIMYQLLPGAPHVGKRLRFSADVRTIGAGTDDGFSGAVLLLQAMRAGAPLAFERMADRPLRGDHGWQRHTVELTIPPGADQVQVGVMLMGNGTVWVDDVRLGSVAPR